MHRLLFEAVSLGNRVVVRLSGSTSMVKNLTTCILSPLMSPSLRLPSSRLEVGVCACACACVCVCVCVCVFSNSCTL